MKGFSFTIKLISTHEYLLLCSLIFNNSLLAISYDHECICKYPFQNVLREAMYYEEDLQAMIPLLRGVSAPLPLQCCDVF